MKCELCDSEAVAIFLLSRGCYCKPAEGEVDYPLCLHHSYKSGPASGGTMLLKEDLTENKEFTLRWNK